MEIRTHRDTDAGLCGTPVFLSEGFSKVELVPTDQMVVDALGLVHGGFIFGLADYAAMLAVNDPNVALGSATVKFMKPVRRGDRIVAEARDLSKEGKRRTVQVSVYREQTLIFEGDFTCFVLKDHVLATPR